MSSTGNVSIRLSLQDAETVRAGLEKLGTDGQAALKKLEAAAAAHQSGGLSAVDKTVSDLKNRVEDTARSIGPLGTLLIGLGPIGLAVAAGIGAAVAVVYEMAKAANELGERAANIRNFADAAQITTGVMQALTNEGAKFGLSNEQISTGLQRLAVNLGEAKRGTGALYDDLFRINPELAHQVAAAKDVASAYDLIGRAIREANAAHDASASAGIARAAFGRNAGEQGSLAADVSASGGANSLAATYSAAGKALDDGLLKKLAELKIQIDETNQRAKDTWASISAGETLGSLLAAANAWERMATAAKDMATATKDESWAHWFARISSGAGAEGGVDLDTQEKLQQETLENSARGRLARMMQSRAAAGPDTPGGGLDADTFSGRFAGADPAAAKKAGDAAKDAQVPIEAVLADTRKWMSVLGSAVTPAEQLRLKMLELDVALKDHSISAQVATRAQKALTDGQLEAATAARERIGVASQEEIQTIGQIQIDKDRADGFIRNDAEMAAAEERLQRQSEQRFKQEQVQNSAFKGLAGEGQTSWTDEIDKAGTSTLNQLGNAVEQNLIDPPKKAGQEWRKFALDVDQSIEQMLIKMTLLKPLANMLEGGLSSLFGGGASASLAASNASATGASASDLANAFAFGGIMTSRGPVPLRRYAGGGIANSAQLAMFGEGSGPEAYVPLPDGRSIPVNLNGGRGGGTSVVAPTIHVHMNIPQGASVEDAHRMTATAARQMRDVVNQAIDDRLVTHMRTGGLLNPS